MTSQNVSRRIKAQWHGMGTSIQKHDSFLSLRFQFQHLLWVCWFSLSYSRFFAMVFCFCACCVSMDFRMLQMPCSTHQCDNHMEGKLAEKISGHLSTWTCTRRLHETCQETSERIGFSYIFRAVSSPHCEGQLGEGRFNFMRKQKRSMHKRTCSSPGKVQQCSYHARQGVKWPDSGDLAWGCYKICVATKQSKKECLSM